MKILFINLPYHGHIVPTVGLVRALVEMGCQVTYLLPVGWETTVAGSGAEFHGYPNHPQLAEQMKNAWSAALKIAPEHDLIVYEQFFFLGKHLAQACGKSAVRIFTCPATNEALMRRFILAKGPMSIFRHRWLSRAFTRDIARGIPMQTDNWLDEIVRNPAELNLVYTLPQFQPDLADFPPERFRFLGPSIYPRQQEPFAFEKTRPLVYISLGTVLKTPAAFFRICYDAFRNADVDVILSAGPRYHPPKARNIPPNFHIYPHVPQTRVLEMADVFITHGGMNSISEALVSSVPTVVIPFVSDQPVNAEGVERLGMGIRLSPECVTAQTLRRAAFHAMEDPGIRKNLQQAAQWIAQSPGNRGGAQMILDYYHRHIARKNIGGTL